MAAINELCWHALLLLATCRPTPWQPHHITIAHVPIPLLDSTLPPPPTHTHITRRSLFPPRPALMITAFVYALHAFDLRVLLSSLLSNNSVLPLAFHQRLEHYCFPALISQILRGLFKKMVIGVSHSSSRRSKRKNCNSKHLPLLIFYTAYLQTKWAGGRHMDTELLYERIWRFGRSLAFRSFFQ